MPWVKAPRYWCLSLSTMFPCEQTDRYWAASGTECRSNSSRLPARPLLNFCPCTSAGCLAEVQFGGQDAKQRDSPMSTPHTPDNGTFKDPAEWTTGDEPMTGAQDSYLHTLARKAGERVADDMSKAEASMKIDELRHKTGVDKVKPKRNASKKAAK